LLRITKRKRPDGRTRQLRFFQSPGAVQSGDVCEDLQFCQPRDARFCDHRRRRIFSNVPPFAWREAMIRCDDAPQSAARTFRQLLPESETTSTSSVRSGLAPLSVPALRHTSTDTKDQRFRMTAGTAKNKGRRRRFDGGPGRGQTEVGPLAGCPCEKTYVLTNLQIPAASFFRS